MATAAKPKSSPPQPVAPRPTKSPSSRQASRTPAKPRSLRQPRPIVYPTEDGKPLGETEPHILWAFRLRELLASHLAGPRFAERRYHVFSNLLLFYQEGDPKKFVVPDVFTVPNCGPGLRDNFLIWREGTRPDVVVELTSRKTRRNDVGHKKSLYRRLGVREYFLYDVTQDFLDPILQGYRLTAANRYARIPASVREPLTLLSEQMGLRLELRSDGWLNLYDSVSGALLRTGLEQAADAERARLAAEQARQNETNARLAAEQARLAAEQRSQSAEQARLAAEAEAARLRAELARLRGEQ